MDIPITNIPDLTIAASQSVIVELHTPGWLETTIFLFFRSLPLLSVFLSILILIVFLFKTVFSKSSSLRAKEIAGVLLTFIFSIVIILALLYLPKTFDDYNALNNVACGFPSPFLTFTSSRSLPDYDYALTDSCIGWLGEPGGAARLQFFWLPFLLDVAIAFCLLTVFFYGIQVIHQKWFHKKRKNNSALINNFSKTFPKKNV